MSIRRGLGAVEVDGDRDLRLLGVARPASARRRPPLSASRRSAASAAAFSASVPMRQPDAARRGVRAEADADAERCAASRASASGSSTSRNRKLPPPLRTALTIGRCGEKSGEPLALRLDPRDPLLVDRPARRRERGQRRLDRRGSAADRAAAPAPRSRSAPASPIAQPIRAPARPKAFDRVRRTTRFGPLAASAARLGVAENSI